MNVGIVPKVLSHDPETPCPIGAWVTRLTVGQLSRVAPDGPLPCLMHRSRVMRQLMADLGLVPREPSSGHRLRRGGITKAGNGEARRVMVEAAWSYRMQARVSRARLGRIEGLPKPVRDIAWKAELRSLRPLPKARRGRQAGQRGDRRHRPREAGLRQGLPTPPPDAPCRVARAAGGGFPKSCGPGLSGRVAQGSRCRGIAAPPAPGRKPQPGSMGKPVYGSLSALLGIGRTATF